MADSKQIILDTPEKTITVDTERDIATIVDRYPSSYNGSEVVSTSYFHMSEIIFHEHQEDSMSFSLSAVHNIEVLRYILKAMGIENYTWLRYTYKGVLSIERIEMIFTDDADYAFFKFKFFNQIRKQNYC